MATFAYKAYDPAGKVIEGVMDAKDHSLVVARLQEMDYYPLEVGPHTAAARSRSTSRLLQRFQRVTSHDVLIVTQQLSTLLNAGLTLDRALGVVADLNKERKVGELVEDIRKSVQGGSTLADALAKHRKAFSRLYINMVRSGEAGGVLEKIFERLAGFMETANEMRQFVISAMIYPLILTAVGGIAVAVLMTYVVPKFTVLFEDAVMPLSTRILLGISGGIRDYWYFILAVVVLGAIGFRNWFRTDKGRIAWDRFSLRLPLIGELVRKIQVARFARTLGTLVLNGVPILRALPITKDTLTNEVMAGALIDVYGGIREGGGISGPLGESGVFPKLCLHMIAVGEETGNLEQMLLKVADTYENEVRTTVRRLISFLEPVMILAMALVVGFVVVSIIQAIFSVYDVPM